MPVAVGAGLWAGTVDVTDEAQVSPGLLGFLATFALALVVGLLFVALRRSLRRVDHGAGQLPGVTALPLARPYQQHPGVLDGAAPTAGPGVGGAASDDTAPDQPAPDGGAASQPS